MPPIRGASGCTMSAAPTSISRACSATLASISPVAIGVSSARARAAWPSASYASSGSSIQTSPNSSKIRPIRIARGAVPLLVGVDHQRDVVVEELPDRGDSGHVGAPVGLADLELDGADAALQRGGAFSLTCSIGVCRKPPEVL